MRSILFLAALLLSFAAQAGGALGANGLRQHHAAIAPHLAASEFGGPLLLRSDEAPRRIEGEVFAVLDHPFESVAAALADPLQWCEILILHLNTKGCRETVVNGRQRIEIRVGRKEPQPPEDAELVAFDWRGATRRADYVAVQMDAEDGPYDTRDYRLFVESVPLDAKHTFIHMGYALSYGGASSVAMKLYLATFGRNKVGFTHERPPTPKDEGYVGGVRGIVERNTMRYYLCIDAYLGSLALPPAQRAEKSIAAWFDATERFARQLHEVDRDDYLRMKREEVRRVYAQQR
ncbi:hypothetical protein [Ramlibacter sp. PS4R-6]|uniref:hypothetical protein n=1 Tax=Ramlibacter sp. PS4R-6 TaxID=3133438 RepID=UPI00309DBEE8